MRRALGFELTTFGPKLLSFIDYIDAHDMNVSTTDAALAWRPTRRAATTIAEKILG